MVRLTTILLSTVFLAGCSKKEQTAAVDPSLPAKTLSDAREELQKAVDNYLKGEKPAPMLRRVAAEDKSTKLDTLAIIVVKEEHEEKGPVIPNRFKANLTWTGRDKKDGLSRRGEFNITFKFNPAKDAWEAH